MLLDKEINTQTHMHDLKKKKQTTKQQQNKKQHQNYSNSSNPQDFILDNPSRNPIIW